MTSSVLYLRVSLDAEKIHGRLTVLRTALTKRQARRLRGKRLARVGRAILDGAVTCKVSHADAA